MKKFGELEMPSPQTGMEWQLIENEIREKRADAIEVLAKAFIEETGLKPSECELVESRGGARTTWYFRGRQ